MPATIREIVDESLAVIGEVAGVGVQQYGEDLVRANVIRGFNLVFKKYPWHQYCKWFRLQLDGTLGIVTTDAFATDTTQVRDFEDFLVVTRDGERTPLPVLTDTQNPYALSSGTTVQYWTSLHSSDDNFEGRRLQFYPVTSTGYVNVRARVYPLGSDQETFDWEDILYLDKDMLADAGAYFTLVGDALNPDSAASVKAMMEMRFIDITKGLSNHPISVGPGGRIPTDWMIRA